MILWHIYIYVYIYIYICTSCSCCVFGLSWSLCLAADVTCFSPYGRPFAPQNQRRWQVTPRTPERRKARIYCNIWAKGSAAWTDLSWQSLVWLETCFHHLSSTVFIFVDVHLAFRSVFSSAALTKQLRICLASGQLSGDSKMPWRHGTGGHWSSPWKTDSVFVGKTLPENPGSVQWWLVCLVGMVGMSMINPS